MYYASAVVLLMKKKAVKNTHAAGLLGQKLDVSSGGGIIVHNTYPIPSEQDS